jgi:hypothetical protein
MHDPNANFAQTASVLKNGPLGSARNSHRR